MTAVAANLAGGAGIGAVLGWIAAQPGWRLMASGAASLILAALLLGIAAGPLVGLTALGSGAVFCLTHASFLAALRRSTAGHVP